MLNDVNNLKKIWLESDLVFLSIIVTSSFIPILFIFNIYGAFYNHDSLLAFVNYKYIFDSFTHNFQIPAWNPYLAYGTSMSLINIGIPGSEYLTILLGKILNSQNSLFFFNLSIAIDTFFYLAGIALCLNYYKIKREVIFLSIIFSAISVNPIHQSAFDFQLIVKLPLLIYSILYVSENLRDRIPIFLLFQFCFIYAGLVPYFSIFYFWLSLLIFFLINRDNHNFKNRKNFPSLNLKLILYGLAITAIFLTYYVNIFDVLTNFQIVSPGRLPNGNSTYNDFISYGGFNGPNKLIRFFGRPPLTEDFDIFLGFITIYLAITTLIYSSKLQQDIRRICNNLWILIAILIIFTHPFSLSIFHLAIYHLPGMSKVRHLSYFITLCKPIFIILSAFGLNFLLSIRQEIFHKKKELLVLILIIMIMMIYKMIFSLILLLIFIIFRKNFLKQQYFSIFYFVIFAISITDLIFHRFIDFPHSKYKGNLTSFNKIKNNDFPFVNRVDPRLSKNFEIFDSSLPKEGFARYSSEISYIKEDYCYQVYRQDYLLKNLYAEMKKDHLNFNPFMKEFPEKEEENLIPKDKYGCNRSKIELVPPNLFNLHNKSIKISDINYKNFPKISNEIISIKSFSPNKINFYVDNFHHQTSLLAYYDNNHPYWEAILDNKAIDIYTLNGSFKSILIPPGKHLVEFRIRKKFILLENFKLLFLSVFFIFLASICTLKIFRRS